MSRGLIKEVNPKEILLENILAVMSRHSFGKKLAMDIVGGEVRLHKLIAAGKIDVEKPNVVQNGKWHCNAAQVLMCVRNTRQIGRKYNH